MTYDPPRLKDGADTPRELGAALDALRRGPGDAARVARVAAKLGPLLDASPPPVPLEPTALPRVGLHTLKAVRLFVAGMAVGASVLWISRWQRHDAAPPVATANSTANSANVSPSTSAAPAQAEPFTVSSHDEGSIAGASAVLATPQSQGARVPTPAAGRGARRGATRTHSTVSPGGSRTPASAPASAHDAAPANAADQAHREPDEPKEPKEPKAAPPQPDLPKGEVELLFEARTLRQRAPRDALLLLDQHAARFADGMLAPEREAMAIEILRGLGQTQQANERLARYRARYPNSLHLPRLDKAPEKAR